MGGTMKVGDCKQFNGIQNESCKAGVRYHSFHGNDAGWALRLPCLQMWREEKPKTKVECSLYEPATEEDIKEQDARFAEALELLQQDLSACCKAPLDHSQIVTRGQFKGNGWLYCSACKKRATHIQGAKNPWR